MKDDSFLLIIIGTTLIFINFKAIKKKRALLVKLLKVVWKI
ncbi:hypothetical protein JTT01_19800 [Clostridium botulinum]|nr:hypothetical protein [Clostridium botulinum]